MRPESLARGSEAGVWLSHTHAFWVCVEGLFPFAGVPGASGCADDYGLAARFREPVGLAMLGGGLHDPARFVVADAGSHRVRKLACCGTAVGGWGRDQEPGHRDGGPEEARFRGPTFLAVNRWFKEPGPWQYSGEFLVSDTGNHVIRRVDAQGVVTTLAGTPGQAGWSDADQPRAARFHDPQGLVMDAEGEVWVADQGNHVLRRIAREGGVTTFAGLPGVPGDEDGTGPGARFRHLTGLALSLRGDLYAADGHAIRRISPAGQVTTVLGLAGRPGFRDRPTQDEPALAGVPCLRDPCGLCVRGPELLIADRGNHALRAFDLRTGTLTTLAGEPASGRIRFSPLQRGEACAALEAPRAVAACEGGELLITTGPCVVELVRQCPFFEGPAAGAGAPPRSQASRLSPQRKQSTQ